MLLIFTIEQIKPHTILNVCGDVRAISIRKYNYFQAIENDLISSGKLVPDTTILKNLLESEELQ